MGYNSDKIKELRFLCTETNQKGESLYMHFKTLDKSFIKVALDGNQNHINLKDFKNSFFALPPPLNLGYQFKSRLDNYLISDINYQGQSPTGSFFQRPFGSTFKKAFWSIVGDDEKDFIFECGNFHRKTNNLKTTEEPASVSTLHSIYFRTEPATESEARNRIIKNIGELAKQAAKAKNDN